MSEVISTLRGLRAGSQGFALLMLSLCVVLHTMCSGNNLEVLGILRSVLGGHQCTSARVKSERSFTSPVRTECGIVVICWMQCCMSLSAVLRGCAVTRRYIDVCDCDMFGVV